MKTILENKEQELLQLLKNNPEAIEKLHKVNRFPLENESTIIFKEESIKDYEKKRTKNIPSNEGAASFFLK